MLQIGEVGDHERGECARAGITQQDIQLLAPISTAVLFNNIPGFFAEGSAAGEWSNNVTVRWLQSEARGCPASD